MWNMILKFGLIAGLIVGVHLVILAFTGHSLPGVWGIVVGYLVMLIALSVVFVAVKQHRDRQLGGVIRFWPAFGMGLAISIVASVLYVLIWEASTAMSGVDFAGDYARSAVATARAQGKTGAALQAVVAEMEAFRKQYADPMFRLPMTFSEIFPVGVLVSLLSAALLRNSSFMPLRRA